MEEVMAQTTAEILAAAEALESRGERVSVRNVRAELGGGDPGTIGRALKQRRETTAAATKAATVAALPDNVTRTLTDWAGRLATELTAAARADLATTSDDYETILAQVDSLQVQIEELNAALATMRQERDTATGALEAVQEHVKTMAADLVAERTKVAELEQRLAGQQAQMLIAEETRRENSDLRSENKRLIEQATASHSAHAAETVRADAAEARATAAEGRARDAEQTAATARAEAAAANARADVADQRTSAAENRADRMQDDVRQLLATLAALKPIQATTFPTEHDVNGQPKERRAKKTASKKKGIPQTEEVESLEMFP